MKISNDTMNILKNFAVINSNLLFRKGNIQRTASPSRDVWATATISESFDREFGVYDLNKFLATLSLFDDPEIELQENHLVISGGGRKIQYFYTDPEMIKPVPASVVMPSRDIAWTVSTKELDELRRAASVLQVSDLSLENIDDKMVMRVCDRKDDTTNSFYLEVAGENVDVDFPVIFKSENLKFIPGTYSATACRRGICEFKNTSRSATYYLGMDIKPSK